MAFPNEVTLSGTLANVEMKQAKSGNFYLTGGLKVYQGKDKDPAWYDIIAFNNDRNNLADHLADCFGGETRSLPVIIKGKLEQSTYENQEGKNVKSYKIIVDEAAVSVVFGPVSILSGSNSVQQPIAKPMGEVAPGEIPF
jgi:single-stranded DNA-binding protein|tara:strand:+ start:2096 stop:2515 length:420 start_codon:yes stop_codon:yes gene_type:complete